MRFLPASVATDLLFTVHAARHDQSSKSAGKSGFKMCRYHGRTAHAGEVLIAKLTGARSRLKAVERSTRRGASEIRSDTFRPIYGISRRSANRQNRVVIISRDGDRQQFSRLPSVFVNTLPEVCRARTPPARVSHVHGVGRSAHRGRADHRSDSEVEAARDRSRVAHTRRASSVVSGDPRGLRAFFPAQCERASGYFLFASPSDRKGRRTCAISGRSHESSSPNLRHGPQPTSRGVVHPREALR